MTTAPSRTVTDKLCNQAMRRVAKKLEEEYERCFPHLPAGPVVFEKIDKLEVKLHEHLAKRPLTKAEIISVEVRAFKAARGMLRKHAGDVVQPKFVEATNIVTGKVRMIPAP
jgi:hypothetical protein